MKTSRVAAALGILVLLTALFIYLPNSASSTNNNLPPSSPSKLEPQPVEAVPAATSGLTKAAPSARMEQSGAWRKMASCVRFKRTAAAVEAQRADPKSWINSAEARAQLLPSDITALEENLNFVDKNQADCSTARVSSFELYTATLESAKRGDESAARCYIMAPWPLPESSAERSTLSSQYERNVASLISEGIRSGSWEFVNLMISTYAGNAPGLRGQFVPNDPIKAYGYVRLRDLSAPASLRDKFGQSSQDFRANLTPQEIATQDSWAADVKDKYFRGKEASENIEKCDY